MAKRQTRRTVSMSRQHYERLTEYAQTHGVSASQITEYVLDAQMATPLDAEAFRTLAGGRAVTQTKRAEDVPRLDRPPSRSVLAARYAHDNNTTYTIAAARFGISAVAVCVAAAKIGLPSRRPGTSPKNELNHAVYEPGITQAQRDEWRDTIQRRMRGRVRTPRSAPVRSAP